jgi:hypothetical protein
VQDCSVCKCYYCIYPLMKGHRDAASHSRFQVLRVGLHPRVEKHRCREPKWYKWLIRFRAVNSLQLFYLPTHVDASLALSFITQTCVDLVWNGCCVVTVLHPARPDVPVEWVALLLHIWKVMGSNLCPDTVYPHC